MHFIVKKMLILFRKNKSRWPLVSLQLSQPLWFNYCPPTNKAIEYATPNLFLFLSASAIKICFVAFYVVASSETSMKRCILIYWWFRYLTQLQLLSTVLKISLVANSTHIQLRMEGKCAPIKMKQLSRRIKVSTPVFLADVPFKFDPSLNYLTTPCYTVILKNNYFERNYTSILSSANVQKWNCVFIWNLVTFKGRRKNLDQITERQFFFKCHTAR